MGNGHIESYHDKLRDECLNRELFGSLPESRIILEAWRVKYNERRPHSGLRYQTQDEFARSRSPPQELLLTQKQTQQNRRASVLNRPTFGVRPMPHMKKT